jgi:hypothetical protein
MFNSTLHNRWGVVMFDAVACETEARSCLRLAKKETDPVVKVLLRSMARSWIGLADQATIASRREPTDLVIHGRC